ncbi:MAG TPA: DNA polymerase/3'-5' exonuclease PolX [Solirubrobacterales bacterium]|nr:DNA polymerase/3'-5' exonuclease PolX [Solirubrobacterales bacterium]
MRNAEIADALGELAALYELDGANRYRVLAYKEASRVVRDCPHSVEEMARDGRATELPGVGDTLQTKIVALVDDGEIPAAEKLKAKFPARLVEVTRIPGLGAKTARKLYDELGIASLEDLREAAEGEKLRGVKGLGQKLEENVLASLERLEDEGPEERRLLSDVLEVGEELVAALEADPASDRVVLAGSARRWAETCKDIDIVATAADPEALSEVLLRHDLAYERRSGGSGGASIRTHNGISVDLRIVPPAEFGNLLQHFTGSKEHNVKLRERALARGLSVSEHGITDTETGEVETCETEAEVYERLGLAYIVPELRQGADELALAESDELPDLVELDGIRGDLHCHTTLSDGHNTLEEMVEAARGRGYSYLAVTDHSASHGFGNDVQADALLERVAEVHELDASTKRIKVLAGSEVNIGTKGELDYEDEVLAELDWVVASVHTSFRMSAEKLTQRIISAIEHPLVDCIGHMTGRLLLKRDPYDLVIEPIFEAAAANGTMIEINSSPRRRDLNERHARIAAEAGVRIVINTDAHRVGTLENMQYGVATARRAGLTAEQVANTRTWRSFAPLRKRTRA